MINEYIRFGEIPDNEHSGIYRGDQGKIGEEIGVSCYECVKDGQGYYHIVMHAKPVVNGTAVTLDWLIDDWSSGKLKPYVIKGNLVGRGSDNEPLLRNIHVIRELEWNEYKNLNH